MMTLLFAILLIFGVCFCLRYLLYVQFVKPRAGCPEFRVLQFYQNDSVREASCAEERIFMQLSNLLSAWQFLMSGGIIIIYIVLL
jgi:hypothetical protein